MICEMVILKLAQATNNNLERRPGLKSNTRCDDLLRVFVVAALLLCTSYLLGIYAFANQGTPTRCTPRMQYNGSKSISNRMVARNESRNRKEKRKLSNLHNSGTISSSTTARLPTVSRFSYATDMFGHWPLQWKQLRSHC